MGLWEKFKSGFGVTAEPNQKIDPSRFYEGKHPELKRTSQTVTASSNSYDEYAYKEILQQARSFDEASYGKQDHSKAFQLYCKAKDLGSKEAFFHLGSLYRFGLGCTKDYDKAISCYSEAINFGIDEAHVYLAYMYADKHLHSDDLSDALNAAKNLDNYFSTQLFMADGKSKIVSQQPFLSKFYTCKSYYEICVDNNLNRNDGHIKPFIPQLISEYTETYLEYWNNGEIDYCDKYKQYIQLIGGKVPMLFPRLRAEKEAPSGQP